MDFTWSSDKEGYDGKERISLANFSSSYKLSFLTLQFLFEDKSFNAGIIDYYKVSAPMTFVM